MYLLFNNKSYLILFVSLIVLLIQANLPSIIVYNNNRINYYRDNLEHEKTIRNQKLYIARLEKKIIKLKKEINKPHVPVANLLDLPID